MPLIPPITDRTQADVDCARAHPDNATANKGALNYHDLNRIEGNCEYLAGQLNGYGYLVSITVKTDWTEDDFPYQSEIDRIRDNINAILAVYHTMSGSPAMDFTDSLNWQDVNSLEQNIENIDTLLNRMISGFRYSGTFFSGQEVILP